MKGKVKNNEDFESDEENLQQRPETDPEVSNSQIIIIFSYQEALYLNWSEVKPKGKNLLRRSYHSCVYFEDNLYVYGGYEANVGILNDFYSIPVPSSSKAFQWTQIQQPSEGQYPGCLRNQTAAVFYDKMYLFGGLLQSLLSTGNLWCYDFLKEQWNLESQVQLEGQKFGIEGHNSLIWKKSENEDFFISFGGFFSNRGYTSSIIAYNFQNKTWSFIFDDKKNTKNQPFPSGRANSGITINKNILYIFGGTDGDARFDDFWSFDLDKGSWSKISPKGALPESRSSPTLIKHPSLECLILFGGIHDITHEKNDLCLYNFEKNEWQVIEEDTSHKINELKVVNTVKKKEKDHLATFQSSNSPMKFHEKDSPRYKQSKMFVPFKRSNNNLSINEVIKYFFLAKQMPTDGQNQSVNNMEELKRKRWQQKKMNMLSEFELDEQEKKTYRCSSPITDQMKNSITTSSHVDEKEANLLSLADNKSVIKDNKNAQQDNQIITMKGKKPCARDGHSTVICKNNMIVIGGDRHLMSFNDIYIFNLNEIKI